MSVVPAKHAQARGTEEQAPQPLIIQPPERCNSCGQNGWEDALLSPTDSRPFSLDHEGLGELAAASQLQLQWDKAMCHELKLPQGYAKICVLLIKWEENDWLENTEKEIHDLKVLFTESFGYLVEVLSLRGGCSCSLPVPCDCSAQLRLDRAVTSFFQKYGGAGHEDNLVILYHTGHGSYDPKKQHLELQGQEPTDERPSPPKVIWNHTEQKFIEVARCDILAIMDCCMAGGVSAIIQGETGRTYEYLAPSKPYQPTNAPGDKSFTRALINSLQSLLEERKGQPFTTFDLHTALSKQKRKGRGYGFLIQRSSFNSRRIELRPVWRDPMYFDGSQIHSYLNLRIELKQNKLTEDELKDLAKLVSRAVRDAKVSTRRVDLLSMESRPPLSLKNVVKQTMSMRQGLLALGKKAILEAVVEEAAMQTPLEQPGLYAVFGWMSSRLRPHKLTIVLQRPWSLIFLGGAAVLIGNRILKGPGVLNRLFAAVFWQSRR